MSGRRLRDNVGCACHLSGPRALHCAQIGKTPTWRGVEICEGRPSKCRSGTISCLFISIDRIFVAISSGRAQIALFCTSEGGDKPAETVPSLGPALSLRNEHVLEGS